MKFSSEVMAETIELLLDCMTERYWKPVAMFGRFGGVQLFLRLITLIADWAAYTGK